MKQVLLASVQASALVVASAAALVVALAAAPGPARAAQAAAPTGSGGASIAAIVNGQIITNDDVTSRARLLALSNGMPATQDALNRLKPQITSELVDQTLQLQEINKRSVVVPESDIADSIAHIEQGNGLPPGGLRQRMEASGVPYSTLVAQIRTQLGWQTVLHQVLGQELQPTAGDMNAEKKALAAELGGTQYHIAEIFIPVSGPEEEATARQFANTVISLLHTGASFPVVATQFSQATTALQGGDRGFVPLNQLDPAVAAVVTAMPAGAISNPIRVPGGYDIVQLEQVHNAGNSSRTILSVRQVFAPFAQPVSNGQLGPAQGAVVEKLEQGAKADRTCADMEATNASFGNVRPADPGPVDLANVSPPQFQAMLTALPLGKVSQPIVAQDGVSVLMICSKEDHAAAMPADDDIKNLIVERRVELESQQLLDQLRHESIITME